VPLNDSFADLRKGMHGRGREKEPVMNLTALTRALTVYGLLTFDRECVKALGYARNPVRRSSLLRRRVAIRRELERRHVFAHSAWWDDPEDEMRRQEDERSRGDAKELSRTDPSLRQLMTDYRSSAEFRLLRGMRSHPTTTGLKPSPMDTLPEQIPSKLESDAGSAAIAKTVTDLLRRRDERGLERPWSVAELGLSADEFLILSTWAAGLDVRTVRLWLGNSWTFETLPSGACYSRQACLGLLLLTFAAEAARREATEGTLWPHVRRDNSGTRRFGSDVDYELFD
jgi:hypothetical protein